MSIMERCIPSKVLPPWWRNLPWINKNLVQSMRKCDNLYRRSKRSGNPIDLEKFKRLRNRTVSRIRQAKENYFNQLNPFNSKLQFWKTVKCLNQQSIIIPTLTHNGSSYHTDKEKADILNNYFTSCFNQHVTPVPAVSITAGECPPDILCTVEEVGCLVLSLDISKANGPDAVSVRMLKKTAHAIAPSVTALFNLSIQTGHIPCDWKLSQVVPIPKWPGAKSPLEFRPISLLSFLSKVLERSFHMLILDHLNQHHPLSNCQWGFQAKKSTVSALISTTHDWLQQLEAGKEIGAVFFDFEKAFDKVPHEHLMSTLASLGLDPHI